MAYQGYIFKPGEPVAIFDQETRCVIKLAKVVGQDGEVVTLNDGSLWLASGWPARPPFDLRMTATSPHLDRQIERQRRLCEIAELATMVRELADKYANIPDVDLETVLVGLRRILDRAAERSRYPETSRRLVEERASRARETPIEEFRYALKMDLDEGSS